MEVGIRPSFVCIVQICTPSCWHLISTEQKAGSEDEYGLSEEEKNQLLSNLEDSVKDIQEESDKINNRITSITN